MKFKKANEWIPADGFTLEKAALDVVKSEDSNLVIAGPGAGKTELLAQRACYLLETNICLKPKKILAISFKVDAASNLKERVEKRCGKDLVSRFTSMTYDAFAKSLLDRFINGLPKDIRPNKDYTIGSGINIDGKKIISFNDITKLAIKIIEENPKIKKALQCTYSHVFLDEFQDTKNIQYKFVKKCFLNSSSIITAVGDGKQRIMSWAGARKTVFEDYIRDFKANKEILIMNHRSAPKLVEIQKAMYSNLNEKKIDVKASLKWKKNDGEAYLRGFIDVCTETDTICNEIKNLINSGTNPRDICILAKQNIDAYGTQIKIKLGSYNIKARNESIYQDLLKDDIVKVLLSIFNISVRKKCPESWMFLNDFFCELEGFDDESKSDKINQIQIKIDKMTKKISKSIKLISNKEKFEQVLEDIKLELPYNKISGIFPKYNNKTLYDEKIMNFKYLLWKEYEIVNDWERAIDNFIGENTIPIMTIHKSKGLEYDAVFFIGLEDSAFWNFSKQPDEDKCAFFVALSRAKKRVDFTFCKNRVTRFNRRQNIENIHELYVMLKKTGLVEIVK